MRHFSRAVIAFAAIPVLTIWAGALVLEIGAPDAYPEAAKMHAVLVAKPTACHEPAKSVVTANVVQLSQGVLRRTPLQVVAVDHAGAFAVVGNVPAGSLIDLAVTNPEYKNYQPRVLIRTGPHGVVWGSARRFYGTPPTDADVQGMLAIGE